MAKLGFVRCAFFVLTGKKRFRFALKGWEPYGANRLGFLTQPFHQEVLLNKTSLCSP